MVVASGHDNNSTGTGSLHASPRGQPRHPGKDRTGEAAVSRPPPSDKGGGQGNFKTPTLREVARTAPYMHDGSFETLEEVVEFYNRGGNQNPYLDSDVTPLHLRGEEKNALVAFLRSLSGEIQEGIVHSSTRTSEMTASASASLSRLDRRGARKRIHMSDSGEALEIMVR